jgi:tetratricopeptide (TPR) repeat protein
LLTDLPADLIQALGPTENLEPAGSRTGTLGSTRLFRSRDAAHPHMLAALVPDPDWMQFQPDPAAIRANLFAARSRDGAPAETVPFLASRAEGSAPWSLGRLHPGVWLTDQIAKNGRAPIPQAIQVIRMASLALSFCHQGKIMAGPIFPEDIWAPLDGKSAQFPWVGFSGAFLSSGDQYPPISRALVPFSPPEVLEGAAWDVSADLYALGCFAYWLLTGEMPYAATEAPELREQQRARKPRTPPELRMGVPPALSELVMRLISTEAHERPLMAQPVADRLGNLGANGGASNAIGDGYGIRADMRGATPLPSALPDWMDGEVKKLKADAEAAGTNPDLWLKLAHSLFRLGRPGDAMVAAEKAFKINPRMGTAALLRVDCMLARGEVKKALHDLQVLAKALPNAPQVLVRLAKAHAAEGNHNKAITDCDTLLQTEPKNVEALMTRAKSHQAMGQFARALDDLDGAVTQAMSGKPGGLAKLLALRAEVNLHLNRHEEAQADLEVALNTDPASVSARQVRVHYLLAVNKPVEAESDCDQLVNQAGRLAWPWLLRARQRQMAGEYQLALEDLDHALEIEATPNSMAQTALLLAAAPEKSVRDSERALELGRKAAEETGWDDPPILEAVAAAYAACGQTETAAGWVLKALTKSKGEDRDRLQEALKLYKAGKPFRLGKA